jgi:Putative addiction module component
VSALLGLGLDQLTPFQPPEVIDYIVRMPYSTYSIGELNMSPQLTDCEAQALQLPPAERAILAEHLIASLDALDETHNEKLWIEEADRRYREYKSGNITSRPAEDALRDARTAIT